MAIGNEKIKKYNSFLTRIVFYLSTQVFQLHMIFNQSKLELHNPNFAYHLIQCNCTHTTWIAKDFIKVVIWLGYKGKLFFYILEIKAPKGLGEH